MTLKDLLKTLTPDTLVGIYNVDDGSAKMPTTQTYQKVKNIPWCKLRHIIDFEVMAVCVVEKNNGLFIRVHDKGRLEKSLNNWDLAEKIRARLK